MASNDNSKKNIKDRKSTSRETVSEDASLYLFQQNNSFRQLCKKVANSTAFEVLMFIIILSSSAKLALDTYITP